MKEGRTLHASLLVRARGLMHGLLFDKTVSNWTQEIALYAWSSIEQENSVSEGIVPVHSLAAAILMCWCLCHSLSQLVMTYAPAALAHTHLPWSCSHHLVPFLLGMQNAESAVLLQRQQ